MDCSCCTVWEAVTNCFLEKFQTPHHLHGSAVHARVPERTSSSQARSRGCRPPIANKLLDHSWRPILEPPICSLSVIALLAHACQKQDLIEQSGDESVGLGKLPCLPAATEQPGRHRRHVKGESQPLRRLNTRCMHNVHASEDMVSLSPPPTQPPVHSAVTNPHEYLISFLYRRLHSPTNS